MTWNRRQFVFACIMLCGFSLASCGEPQDRPETGGIPVDPVTAGEQSLIGIQDAAAYKPERRKLEPAIEKEVPRKPLDLSMPPQPEISLQSKEGLDDRDGNLLPDLFQRSEKPGEERATQIRGRVLMREGEEQSLDSFEGGQLIIEKKTR